MNDIQKNFSAKDVVELYKCLVQNNIKIWLDGGWGVDALLGQQTRLHSDLDIIIESKHLELLSKILKSRGYKEIPRDDSSSWNFVVADAFGHEVDIHVVDFDVHGHGIYGPKERGVYYPAAAFVGKGNILDLQVNCLTPEYQVESHQGYQLKEKDFKDVFLLCERFELEIPKEYQNFKK